MKFDSEELRHTIYHNTFNMSDAILGAMERITARANNLSGMDGIRTGFHDLDGMVRGLQESQFIIVGGRPSMGKTGLALNICEHVLCEEKKAILYLSLELDGLELMERMLSSKARVDGFKIRTGQGIGEDEMGRLGTAYDELRELPLWIDCTPSSTMSQIMARARSIKGRQDIDLIVIDDVQMIEPENSRSSRHEQIDRICRQLKQLAREMQTPVIALSQLKRRVDERQDHRPRLSDLSGLKSAGEEKADLVLLLHRPEYYDENDQPGIAELTVAKNPMGPTGVMRMAFHRGINRFENLKQEAQYLLDPPR